MTLGSKRVWTTIGAVGVVAIGVWIIQSGRQAEGRESWTPEQEGLLAVARPSGAAATLWSDVDEPHARPATASEAATWINAWPYQSRALGENLDVPAPGIAVRSREVRCTGTPTGDTVPQRGNEEETVEALRQRLECTYAKWMIWSGETASEHPNERHTVWADERGRFHGRVDYWR